MQLSQVRPAVPALVSDGAVRGSDGSVRGSDGSVRASSGGPLSTDGDLPQFVRVVHWPDPIVDQIGHDARSTYAERFWLPVIGPSCLWLLRNIAASLEATPSGFELDFEKTARQIGLGDRKSRRSPFQRSIGRLVTFELAHFVDPETLAVRRCLPILPPRYMMRLGPDGYAAHRDWLETLESRDPEISRLRSRARRIALGLFALGGDVVSVETELLGWPIHPALAWDAVDWAQRESGMRESGRREKAGRGSAQKSSRATEGSTR